MESIIILHSKTYHDSVYIDDVSEIDGYAIVNGKSLEISDPSIVYNFRRSIRRYTHHHCPQVVSCTGYISFVSLKFLYNSWSGMFL